MNFVKIRSITPSETEPIYHLTVEKNHNFFGNGILLHNCDYFNNEDNDGNIAVCLYNPTKFDVNINAGDSIVQGIFKKYLTVEDDVCMGERKGGIGHTGN